MRAGRRTELEFGPLVQLAVRLDTANGDQRHWAGQLSDAARVAGVEMTLLHLFPMPSVDAVEAHLLARDVV